MFRHYLKEYLGNKASEVGFLILKEDIIRVDINFLRAVVEVEAVIQILLISLRIQNSISDTMVLKISPMSPDECVLSDVESQQHQAMLADSG